jgi:hypothetical protein
MAKPKAVAEIDDDQKIDPALTEQLAKVLEALRDLED